MKPKKGDSGSEMEEDLKDPLQLTKELVLLIVEARTPDVSVKGRVEGPHCPVLRGRVAHKCTVDKVECTRASEFCCQTHQLYHNNIPICLDILFFPECYHGLQESLATEGNGAVATEENSLLIERWTIKSLRRRQDEGMSSNLLLQAVRSYLHFSQISSWLYSTGGKLPGYLVYRVYAPGEEANLQFSEPPDKHTFPVCSAKHTEVTVSVLSLKRQPSVPILLCALRKSSESQSQAAGDKWQHDATDEAVRISSSKVVHNGNSVEAGTHSASSAKSSRGAVSKRAGEEKNGWYKHKTSDSIGGKSENYPPNDATNYQKLQAKIYNESSTQKKLMTDRDGARKKGNKVKKKDGEKDERIDKRKTKFQKNLDHDMFNWEDTNDDMFDQSELMVGLVAGSAKDKVMTFSDKSIGTSQLEEHLFLSQHKDFEIFQRKSCERAYIDKLSKRLGTKNHRQIKTVPESCHLGQTFLEPAAKFSEHSYNSSETFMDGMSAQDVVGKFNHDANCFSELSIMVPHVYDIYEDSDSTPVPSPNQMTISFKGRPDTTMVEKACDLSYSNTFSQKPMVSCSDSCSFSSTVPKETEAKYSPNSLSTYQDISGRAAATKEVSSKIVIDGPISQNKPHAPCSRKLFQDNLLPLVSYDANSDSFVQVDLSTQTKVLHSPKVLFSCDIPHDYSHIQPTQKKCIDFGETSESQYFKDKLLSDVLDVSSINKYMSCLNALSTDLADKTSMDVSDSTIVQADSVKFEDPDSSCPGMHNSRDEFMYNSSHSLKTTCYEGFAESQTVGSDDVLQNVLEDQHTCTSSPSLSSSSSSSSSICVPSSSLHEVSSSEQLVCPDGLVTETSFKNSMDATSTSAVNPFLYNNKENNTTLSLSTDSDRQPLIQAKGHDLNSSLSPTNLINSVILTSGQNGANHSNSKHLSSDQSECLNSLLAHCDDQGQCISTHSPTIKESNQSYSSLSIHCDRDVRQSSHLLSTSSNTNPLIASQTSSFWTENSLETDLIRSDIEAATNSGNCINSDTCDVNQRNIASESHSNTSKKTQNGSIYVHSSVPLQKDNLWHNSSESKTIKVTTEAVNFGLSSKRNSDDANVVFYLSDNSASQSTNVSSMFSTDLHTVSTSDMVSSLSLESNPEIRSRTNYESKPMSGSPPLHGDPPGWTSVPPHRTVSTPSCMDREENTQGQRSAQPGMMMRKVDTTSQLGLRKMAVKSASMIFNSRSGLPTQSSPAPLKRNPGGSFDYDANLLNTRALKNAFSCSKLAMNRSAKSPENEEERKRALSTSAPASTNCLLGNFEESILNGRIEPVGTVEGFSAEVGASGSFCPKHLYLPVSAFFFALSEDNAPSPYLGHINLEVVSKKGYHIPKKGTVQVTLFNPNKTVVKMFVVMYDLSDMPASSQTFIRQRTVYSPTDNNSTAPSFLRYLIHLRCASSRSGKIYLHTDIRLIFARHKLDIDAKNISYELKSYTEGPINPKYSPKK
ncbi:protein FAM214A [Biomphalaria pfeifferi]|uniref:Protein FAM214A n=1 Tax=Biomphalaria pfeifferi TaxID=112525 RepID=A0AAD8FA93_BIOPF|nr:protein FAM214A [Biomphalaria pfeifferi]